MAKLQQDNIGAQSQDGINAKVGITFLAPNRSILMLPLQQDCPTDPDEMVVEGEATYSIGNMFKALKPSVEVSLSTGDEANPMQDVEIKFQGLKNFEPDDIVDAVPLLRAMKDQQTLISRLESLMQEGSFRKMMEDKDKKSALVSFLRSVITDIETTEEDD
jgi:Type VI secretion system, VipA, VC_A0107 or Hcp2